MAKKTDTLDDLRREIDGVDTSIHDLIVRRTEIVERVREVKRDTLVKIRPAREAEILYRLMTRHTGPFPKCELAHMWREMIVATLSFEGPFSVAVYVTDEIPGYWDLARDQYGSFTPMTRHSSNRSVVEAVRIQNATLGILPLPQRDGSENWWRFLVSETPEAPKVIARLPFIGEGNARDPGIEALVIGLVAQEETGRDRSFVAIVAEEDIGFALIEAALSQAGHSAAFHQVWHDPDRPPEWSYLVEVFGFFNDSGQRMERFMDALGRRTKPVVHLGGYATPLSEGDLAPSIAGAPGTK